MDGWMVEGERELRRVSMTRLGCLVVCAESGMIFKVRPKTRHLSSSPNFSESAQSKSTLKVSLRFWSLLLYSVPGRQNRSLKMIHNRANSDVEVNIAPFSTDERRKRGRNDKYSHSPARVTPPLIVTPGLLNLPQIRTSTFSTAMMFDITQTLSV